MLPAPPRILICPDCATAKPVLNLTSGNTFGGQLWSDTKGEYPMLPQLSPIQRCPNCGHFYFTQDQIYRDDDRMGFSFDTGELCWDDCKDALAFFNLNTLSEEKAFILRLHTVYAYNTEFYRHRHTAAPTPQDRTLFTQNVLALIDLIANKSEHTPLCVELYREIGEFEKAKELLTTYTPSSDDEEAALTQIEEHIDRKDPTVFIIEFDDRL